MIVYLAFGLSLVAIAIGWSFYRKNSELKERIAQVNSRVYQLRQEMQEAQATAEQQMLELKFQLLQLKGELKVTPEMKIGQVLAIHPQAQQVLAGFHLGGCGSCAVDNNQSLAEAAAVNGRHLEPILVALNGLITASDGSGGNGFSGEPLKTPNIQLHF